MKKGKAKKKSNKKKIIQKKNIKRKTNSKCKPSKMSLRQKEFMAITILAVFVFAFLLASMNAPSQNTTITGQGIKGLEKVDTSGIGTLLSNFMDPVQADATVMKWVIFFVFVVGLWGVLYFFKGKNGKPLNPFFMILAFPIAYAMVYLLNTTEILAAIVPYSALGLAIIVGAPFVGIVLGSLYLLQGRRNATKVVVQLLAWYFYLACLIYFLFRTFTAPETYSGWILAIIGGGIIFSIILIVKNQQWRDWIAKLEREGVGKEIRDVQHALGVEKEEERYRGEMWRNPSRKR